MKHSSLLLAMPLLLAGCGVTRIVTVAPDPAPVQTVVVAQPAAQPQVVVAQPVSTTVTYPRTRTTRTTTIQVTPLTQDISLYLDLQAVAAAFGQASTVEEFELILNSNAYMISNLDLNGDGYIDYLRVLETLDGHTHVLLIQAVLAANIYQDVATLVVEMGFAQPYVQLIGAPYIYGVNYIIEPVYYTRPPLYDRFGRPNYAYWRSPYYWDHFPHHYGHHAPYHLGHYQAYVSTFMQHHHYCHTVHYVEHHHYVHYEDVSRPVSRNDYSSQHPEQDFSRRTTATYIPAGSTTATRVTNARHLQQAVEQSGASRTTTSTRSSGTSTRTTDTSTRTSGTSTRTSTSTRTTDNNAATRQSQSSAGKQAAATRQSQSSAGKQAATTRQSQSSSEKQAAATRQSQQSGKTTPATRTSTTDTRVRQSGTTSTKRTQSASGTKASGTRSSTSTRSSSSGSSTRTSGTSGSSTRSSGTSTKRTSDNTSTRR